ncbi:IclR family transcriptional regulator [Cryptosporangium arvum]|uniref:IclR family transcriptional regulator n=1 Tax=Cryptosporangium arvum TaxID=80871 RepID=UPI001B801235|nr:IclR family transcriptional regulator [Cryptosporangium arvum]
MRNSERLTREAPPPSGGVQSVDRAISVLEILARRGEAGVSEVAAELAVHKSTAFRLLETLEERSMVEQTADRGKYRLGFGVVRLAGAVSARLDVVQQGHAPCEQLADTVGETVNLAVLREHYAVNIDQVRGRATVTTHNWVGQLTPLHATSSGKVLLAALAPKEREAAYAAGGLDAYTPATLVEVPVLDEHLADVRQRGYAVTVEEYEIGLNAVAAPVRGADGSVVAAVSASGPAYRCPEERLHEIAPAVVATGEEISRRLGYFGT